MARSAKKTLWDVASSKSGLLGENSMLKSNRKRALGGISSKRKAKIGLTYSKWCEGEWRSGQCAVVGEA